MKDGILVLNKPRNYTSHDCVAVCRKVLGIKKIGHGGALDPMAEGVLPVFIGKATRIMEYLDLDYKTYVCRAKLGITSDTLDIWGKTEKAGDTAGIKEEDIAGTLEGFKGEIQQIPPMYSALKVNGKKLYQYARDGKHVEVKPRNVHIRALDIININMEDMEVDFKVVCSKGTYIRSICRDLGAKLGCGAVMSGLMRTGSGIFTLDKSVDIERIKTMAPESIADLIIPTDKPLVHMGEIMMKRDRALYFASGNSIRLPQVEIVRKPSLQPLYRVYCRETGQFLGTGCIDRENNILKADKIFVTRQDV